MKTKVRVLAIAIGLFCAASSFAQNAVSAAVGNATSAASTAASTAANSAVAKAKDGATAAVAAKMAPVPTPGPVVAPIPPAVPVKMAATGGAAKVWVNKGSKTYHCEGSKFYGKTKAGEYMSEAEAKAQGHHAVKGKACAK